MRKDTPIEILLDVRGEKPTRAGPNSRAEAAGGSAAGDWPWGRTRAAPRGVVTEWSARSEPLRFRLVAFQRRAPVRRVRVAWGCSSAASLAGWIRISPSVPGRGYRGRGARRHLMATTGTLTPSRRNSSGWVTGRYKLYEIWPECGGEPDCLSRLPGGLSISRIRPSLPPNKPRRAHWETSWSPRGVTAAEG
jgi:hypothetical protein